MFISKVLFVGLCFIGLFIIEGIITLILELYVNHKFKKYLNNRPELLNMEKEDRDKLIDKKLDVWIENYLVKDIESDLRKGLRFLGFVILFILFRPISWRLLAIKAIEEI